MKRSRSFLKKWTGAFQIAAVYVGTIVGAGFATGKEIVEFFTQYGFYGFLGMLLAGGLFIYLGTKVMITAIRIKAKSYENVNEHLFGQKLGKMMNVLMLFMLIGVCGVMLSGAEALFSEQLGLSKLLGSLITILLVLIVMAIGVKGLFAVNVFVVPILILFNICVMFVAIVTPQFWEQLFFFPESINIGSAGLSALSYVAFNLSLSQAVLVPIAVEVGEEEIVKLGGYLGGALLSLILISSHLTLTSLPGFYLYEIPMAVIVNQTISQIYFIYLFIIYGEIFTSLIGNLYGLEKQIQQYISVKSLWVHSFVIFIVYFISRVEYGTLLGVLYPLFGYIGLIFLFLLWIKPKQGEL